MTERIVEDLRQLHRRVEAALRDEALRVRLRAVWVDQMTQEFATAGFGAWKVKNPRVDLIETGAYRNAMLTRPKGTFAYRYKGGTISFGLTANALPYQKYIIQWPTAAGWQATVKRVVARWEAEVLAYIAETFTPVRGTRRKSASARRKR